MMRIRTSKPLYPALEFYVYLMFLRQMVRADTSTPNAVLICFRGPF